MEDKYEKENEVLAGVIQKLLRLVVVLIFALVLMPIIYANEDFFHRLFQASGKKETSTNVQNNSTPLSSTPVINFWRPNDIATIVDGSLRSQIEYGKDLIAHTSKFLGPNGSVAQLSNGMNCQNCHLDAGTRIWGNNYGSVASTYPKFRARSGASEDVFKRVNDCFERSLNGKALDTASNELLAIRAYIQFLGSNVESGQKAIGSGFKDIPFLDRAADPIKGKEVYVAKCQSCHKENGEGALLADGSEYAYPPLWGKHSYNDGAGLYRLSNFAKYVKYNMPWGATYENPQLSDEEAWDLAAYVNSQARPHKSVPKDWPDVSKKPIDHPFGPFSDNFPADQHKFGPFKPIDDYRKTLSDGKK